MKMSRKRFLSFKHSMAEYYKKKMSLSLMFSTKITRKSDKQDRFLRCKVTELFLYLLVHYYSLNDVCNEIYSLGSIFT